MQVVFGVEALKHQRFDHSKPLTEMTPEEILNEYLFLWSGHADEKERHGIKVGLPEDLKPRLSMLQEHILNAIALESSTMTAP
jgi:hypothetical protein